ncbi:(Fe-S)-binding protein [Natronospira bacteriovora]|uniref:Glycolate oxidase iron-sulfur subunit n=1 Tax=Natronospira bacteriovora TaxID=3069753 RepID=A0ABU0W8W4_9GAMM|nr:(Fe-S)-binding protein [Natronospira sp. AB-CW4]MDQ2070358.1 (Fe-S)-binding protein [Natronospira sp. AB-CW4]
MKRSIPSQKHARMPERPTQSNGRAANGRVEFPLADADLCVKCALCLPHCPTYRLFQDESESPRGRIALMQGLATEQLDPSAKLARHLDQCLGCRNCEPVCPAKVPYGRLIDHGRALLAAQRPRPRIERLAAWLFARPAWLRRLVTLLRWSERLGLRTLTRMAVLPLMPALKRLERRLPATRKAPPSRPARSGQGKPVQLFLGCIAEQIDPDVSSAIIRLLQATGHEVQIPVDQGCCGALAQHGGDLSGAARLSTRNVNAFTGEAPVLTSATGCAATLMEYPELDDGAAHVNFAGRVRDVSQYLSRLDRIHSLDWKAQHARILVHQPCSHRNVVGGTDDVRALLSAIPGLELTTLDGKGQCCGAAGAYLLTQPDIADRLGRSLADQVCLHRPDVVITSNIGCKLQLRAQLAERLPHCEVLHPVELLARSLPDKA